MNNEQIYYEESNVKQLGDLFLKAVIGFGVFVASFVIVFYVVRLNYGIKSGTYVLVFYGIASIVGGILLSFSTLAGVIIRIVDIVAKAISRHDFIDAMGDRVRHGGPVGKSEPWLQEVTKFASTTGKQNVDLITLMSKELESRGIDISTLDTIDSIEDSQSNEIGDMQV